MATNAYLVNGCVAFWKMDETTGTRVDSVGSFNLAESAGPVLGSNFSPQFQAGVLAGPVASFVPLQALERTNGTDLHLGSGDFTVTGWFNISTAVSNGSSRNIAGKYAGETSGFNWALGAFPGSSSGVNFNVGTGTSGAGNDVMQINIPGRLVTDRWYFAVGRRAALGRAEVICFGGSAETPSLQGTWFSTSRTLGGGNGTGLFMASSVSRFAVGAWDSSAGTLTSGTGFPGKIANVGIWSRALSDSEIGDLWNGGYGLDYPFGYPA